LPFSFSWLPAAGIHGRKRCRPGVVLVEGVPGAEPVRVDVRVAEVAVEEVEQRRHLLDAADDVGRRRGGDGAGHGREGAGRRPGPQVVLGVAWSPKLVKVKGLRPDGAVRKAAESGRTPSWRAL